MATIDNGMFINFVMSMLLKKIVVPSGYHERVKVVKEMQEDDLSGLVDSLTDFAIDSASVNFTIETENEKFTTILKEWLERINVAYNGKIPPGINELAKEYFKERWKYSSFPVLKISKWESIDGVILPTKMYFVDGGSIYAKDKNEKDDNLSLFSYNYYLGSATEKPLQKGTIFSRPYGRWFDKYPTPYLIKRGVYHNWKIVQSLKRQQSKILEQVIPYLFLIKKGTEGLARDNIKTYSNPELQQIIEDFQKLMDDMKSTKLGEKQIKSPIRATNFDEDLKHLIPDLKTVFDPVLFAQAERNILAGLGFIDIAQSISESRRESVLNPKVFIEEVKTGVDDFKNHILKPLIFMIQEKNKRHRKYVKNKFYICSSPIGTFMTDDFKEKIRQLYDRGRISSQTAVELIAETDFQTEVYRREREAKKGISETMYPPVRENREGEGIDLPADFEAPKDTDEEEIPDDKKDEVEKKNYDVSELETAPYRTIKELPSRIKKNMSPGLQRTFLRVFNNAFQQYHNETRAFRVAWAVIKKIARRNKKGKWVRKAKAKLTRAMLENVLEKEDEKTIKEVMDEKKLEIANKQSKLLDKLLGKNKDK